MELLSVDEMVRVARICTGLGVDKIRLTGGEPTMHPRLTQIISAMAALPIADLAMTTNGSRGGRDTLTAWRQAGLKRLTVSIDSVDPVRFQEITRSTTPLAEVLDNIRLGVRIGFQPFRLNAVVIRGVNDDQILPLTDLAREMGVEMRFIEFMPLDAGHGWTLDRVVAADEMLATIHAVHPLEPRGRSGKSSTSDEFVFGDGAPGRIGFIAPVSRPFCGACSRLRITADGKVRPCLFSREEWDIRPLLRGGASDEAIGQFLQDATWAKQAGHGIAAPGFVQPERTMSAIGG